MSELQGYYYDVSLPSSYGGSENLKRSLKKDSKRKLESEVDDWLMGEDAYTLHKPITRKFKRRKTIVKGPNEQFQSDLIDVQSHAKNNDNKRYLHTTIDIFTKEAFVEAIENKSAAVVAKSLAKLFAKKAPKYLQTDKGKEFLNNEVKQVLKRFNVKHFTSENENVKCAVVERLNQTLRNTMHRYFTKTNTDRYIDVLPDIVNAYNNRYHKSIGMSPNQANSMNDYEDLFYTLYDPITAFKKSPRKLEIGDYVRISKARTAFQRGFTPNWSVEVFIVTHILPTTPITYRIQDWSEEPIEGSFYIEELQKIKKPETFRIEKILQKKKIGRRKMVFVKWLGYPDSFNQWIPESDVTD